MPEETEVVEGTTPETPVAETSPAAEELAVEGSDTPKTEPSVEEGRETVSTEDPEVELNIGGKSFTMKQSEAVQLLENATKLTEREKTLTEKEKSFNQFNTREGQKNAAFRNSIKEAFGYFPEPSELSAMGKLVKAYQKNPEVKQTIDQILSGRGVSNGKAQNLAPEAQYIAQLESKIADMEERLEGFVSSSQEERNAKETAENKRTWDTWVAEKAKSNVKITEEVEAKMVPFIAALKNADPSRDNTEILNDAYEHANIKNLKSTVTGQVLKSADNARKTPIRITPKQPAKSDKTQGYADIIRDAATA